MMNETAGMNQGTGLDATQARSWAIACHLSPLVAFLGIPLGHIVGPLMVWLVKKHESPLVDQQGREALNFHLSVTLYVVLLALIVFLPGVALIAFGKPWAFLGLSLFVLAAVAGLALVVADFVLIIVAAVKTSEGEPFRYPLSIRFV